MPVFADRISETDVGFPGGIPIAVFSVYLFCGEGLSKRNLDILSALLVAVLSLDQPWCIGGDFNLEPQDLISSGFLEKAGGELAASCQATCFQANTELDYFVVSQALSAYARSVRICEGAPCWPHAPVALSLKGLRSQQVIWKQRLFKKPVLDAIGPKQPIPDGHFGWQVGSDEPPAFEEGLSTWLAQVELQLLTFQDLKPEDCPRQVGRSNGPQLVPISLAREEANKRWQASCEQGRLLTSMAVLAAQLARANESGKEDEAYRVRFSKLSKIEVQLPDAEQEASDCDEIIPSTP